MVAALGDEAVTVETDAADRAALTARLVGLAAEGARFAGVVSLLASPAADTLPVGPARPGEAVEALAAGIDAPLWCVTRGAVSVGRSDAETSAAQAAVWGLGRVTALEHPDRWGGLADVPHVLDRRSADRLRAVLSGTDGEDQVALRPSGAFGRRLTRATADSPSAPWPRRRSWSPATWPPADTCSAGSPSRAPSASCWPRPPRRTSRTWSPNSPSWARR
ncbi:hypothetical protein ACFQ2B_00735 [Streptomyces stramineus]